MRCFETFDDKNEKGYIDPLFLSRLITKLGQNPSSQAVQTEF